MKATAWLGPASLAVALTVWPLHARGQSSSAEPKAGAATAERPDSPVARARMHFLLGMQFFEVRAYRDAIREFELATALAPSADVWFNIGRAREELGEDAQAKAAFERYLRDRVDAPDAEAVRARLATIEQRLRSGTRNFGASGGTGSLRVHVQTEGEPEALDTPSNAPSQITLDGRSIPTSQRGQPIILETGLHRLYVTRPGFIPFRAEVSIEAGMLTAAHARLAPLSDLPSAPAASRSWTWVAMGVAAAGVLGTGIMGAIALDRQSDGDQNDARAWAKRSDAALAGTSVCALAAALLYFIEAPPARTPSSTQVQQEGPLRAD